ncbi:uncharacterized protein MONOS_14647 [Monocercomonoides exilis]|uniref:uncharacterized protein n=1 Tax=Monocercomonoides exilis TaxID=2049356 RepID=UPI0035599BD8|nr:hypothetical protein MONOS_14647 [Monocercomonoides exilis]|eukprot:MONOS_14647.1-p1 / transcript=MONOS_14647.1 / gene=MONOS_14647 / organism=Monocercomonoides_exilis_PA203 / gene_product=unspecified product / transcript_product=unspecified product / location=Mono_scaffold01040:13943-15100(+) / protein_length=346 / sequence_SO=supercontig / SO=protein_coding / is_pseudo=false
MISGCEFQDCEANSYGGGLNLDNFQVSGSGCIPTENGGGESACVFDCSFTSCSVTGNDGGGMRCINIPITQFKMRSIQTTSTPYGHDAYFVDAYNLYLSSINPFYECYTTNTDDKRMCYAYNPSGTWIYDQTSKRDWLKDKTIYVSVGGDDNIELCGMNESNPCLTVKKAFEMCEVQISLSITLMEGNHQNETSTIDIGAQKISVIGRGKDKSSIGTGALSSTGALFSVSTGHLGLLHMKVDCNSNASPSSPSVFVVSVGSGTLSLEDVLIFSSVNGEREISASIFVMALSQLRMSDVEIKNMKMSQPLFEEPSTEESTSGESLLGNVTIRNVNRITGGDGVVMA